MCRSILLLLSMLLLASARAGEPGNRYLQALLEEGPSVYIALDEEAGQPVRARLLDSDTRAVLGRVIRARQGERGPRPESYPPFEPDNRAVAFDGAGSRIVFPDPGADSVFDFDLGDTISLEAWVFPESLGDGQQVYVIGKGRTGNQKFSRANQNWSLRLRGVDGEARISFLFRDHRNRPENSPEGNQDWHRWTSGEGFEVGDGWHHVGLTYTFGEPDSLVGYLDGRPVGGRWDLGGPTKLPPVVDDDAVWIGSSQGGQRGNSFDGLIDEVVLFRQRIDPERLAARYGTGIRRRSLSGLEDLEAPRDSVLTEIIEGVRDGRPWQLNARARRTHTERRPVFAWHHLPRTYNSRGIITDRSNPYLLRASSRVTLEAGEYEILLRGYNAARLHLDGELITALPLKGRNADGHEDVPDQAPPGHPGLRALPAGHRQEILRREIAAGEHEFRLEVQVGGKGLRPEVGELGVALRRLSADGDAGGEFILLGHGEPTTLSDSGWEDFLRRDRATWRALNRKARTEASREVAERFRKRHRLVRDYVDALPPLEIPPGDAPSIVDRFIDHRLRQEGVEPTEPLTDREFLRRTSLAVRGVPPIPAEIREFFADEAPGRRARFIDRILEDPSWSDRWVGYWQDVLAENPGLLKPKLNNSGPFRWWLHEALLDNKPMDRFVWELLRMEGSRHAGGTAGFAVATENDVPMAAKAHIVGTAFLGVEMKCARCHDAPYHPYTQKNLFELAGLLEQGSLKVPESSSIPGGPEAVEDLIVEVTLKPGEVIEPEWPFSDLAPAASAEFGDPLETSRDRLAATITSPRNLRFARVIANRLWKVYLGRGLVEPVDDWDGFPPSHPGLLDYLGREFLRSGYDLKALSRLILNSRVYQRRPGEALVERDGSTWPLFDGPYRQRLEAEQLVDSLFHVAGKAPGSEELNLDLDGRRPVTTFLNFGTPHRAWEFTSLSNERDRPALAMPVAQSIVDLLRTFGWRESRQNPVSTREVSMTPLEPLMLANGTVAHRVVTLSDGGAFTRLALEAPDPGSLVENLYERILTRLPDETEKALFTELLAGGFDTRVREVTPGSKTGNASRVQVSWSNHLSAEATRIKLELERQARRGDPPTARLEPDWRERCEDLIWSLVNAPEFVFSP